jgi:recombination protein RecR
MFTGRLGELQQQLRRLPGIGDKTAQRLALHLLTRGREHALTLARSLVEAVETYRLCPVCNCMTETDPCPICADTTRDASLLCVVEGSQDVFLLENTREYKGYYFVLGHLLSPLDGIGPEEIRFPQLRKLVGERQPREVILAINPSAEGETTIHYLATELADLNVRVTRLSTGIPFGGDIGYSSTVTLSNALTRRYTV